MHRLPPAHCAWFESGQLTVAPYWVPHFEEPARADFPALAAEFRQLVQDAVATQLDGSKPACFLSGGTDSSTVAGMMKQLAGRAATYSIGFEAEGYDEMQYARIAARRFGTEHHEYYVTPDDLVRSIPAVAAHYDQPFGNSSVLPAYYCAKMAREDGVTKLLAGDGGDELYGGNARYAKQRVFGFYDNVPRLLRHGLLEPLLEKTPLGASSTVAGMIGEVAGRPAATYSIGFEAEGYDEMAVRAHRRQRFGTEHHEYYVTPDDLVRSIPAVAAHYDQPFGNSSALPAYYCAKMAREDGVTQLLAGDGGDELFGGNARYAKQRVFGWYDGVPAGAAQGPAGAAAGAHAAGHAAAGAQGPQLRRAGQGADARPHADVQPAAAPGPGAGVHARLPGPGGPADPLRQQRAVWQQVPATPAR